MRIKFYTDRPFGMNVRNWLIEQGEEIVQDNPDLIISCYNPYIIPKEELTVPAVNFHPGYLPFNRGMYPHIWPIVDGSPAGVTLHWIDLEELDGGDIIAQEKVILYPTDIAADFEKRTQATMFRLFKLNWDSIKKQVKSGNIRGSKQGKISSYNPAKRIKTIQEIPLEIANKLRACTFYDRSYAYYFDEHRIKRYIGIKYFSEFDIKKFEEKNHA